MTRKNTTDRCHQDAVALVQALRNTTVAVLEESASYARQEAARGTMSPRTLDVILAQLRYLGHREARS